MRKRLKLDDLQVESFSTSIPEGRGTVVAHSGECSGEGCTHYAGGCTTHSLNATHCNCSGDALCTLACVEVSQATDIQACCG
jgi:hypothetical protein